MAKRLTRKTVAPHKGEVIRSVHNRPRYMRLLCPMWGPEDRVQPKRLPRVAEGVGDRIAPVAAEIARAELDAGCRLPALVFGNVQKLLDPLDRRRIVAFG